MNNRSDTKEKRKRLTRITKITGIFILFFMALFQSSSVEAHSTLLEMEPAENIVIQDPPSSLKLRFNEPLEHDLAMITVYNWNAKPVFTGNPDGDVERAPLLEFSLPKLEQGTYTVKWSVVSADGHPVSGSYAFSVGQPTKGDVKSAGDGGNTASALIAARVIPEGFLLLGAGLFWFGWLAERKKFPSLNTLWMKGRLTGAILILLGTIAELITYGFSLPTGIIQVIFSGRWELLLQFPFVLMLFAQLFLLILLFIPGMIRGWYLTLWMALAVTPAFGGHVWGMKDPLVALIPRVIHQVSIAFWLGALSYVILLLIWQKKQDTSISWKKFRPFFVNNMMIASGLVIVSGVIMAYLQTGISAVFTDWKTWSTLIIIKIILTITMLGMAMFQTLKWKRNEKFMTEPVIRREWIVGLVIIVFGIWMSQIAYPIAIKTYDETLTTDEIKADINIDKLQMGNREMMAEVSGFDGEPPEEVIVEVSMPQHDMGSGELIAEKDESGNYIVDLPFTMSGIWIFEMTATYPDGEEKEWQDEIFIEGNGN